MGLHDTELVRADFELWTKKYLQLNKIYADNMSVWYNFFTQRSNSEQT